MKWTATMSIGIEAIDADHKKLFDLLDELDALLIRKASGEELENVLERLVDYTVYHFRREEALLEGNGYPAWQQHKSSHDRFVAQAADILQRFRAGQTQVVSRDIVEGVRTWLADHVTKDDRAYEPFLRQRFGELPTFSPHSLAFAPVRAVAISVAIMAAPIAMALFAAPDATLASIESRLLVGEAAAAAVALVLTTIIGGGMVKPVRELVIALKRLADSDLDTRIPGGRRRDQFGKLAAALELVKLNIWEIRRSTEEAKQQEQRASLVRRHALRGVATTFQDTVQQLLPNIVATIRTLRERSGTVFEEIGGTTDQCSQACSLSEGVVDSITAAAQSAHALSSSINQVKSGVDEASAIAGQAVAAAEHAGLAITTLAAETEKIGDIVKLINDVAAQTNLLALNATIEAARAGEAGKGFAVVANEVKHLASQTARATGDISAQIEAIQQGATGVVKEIEEIRAIITRLNDISIHAAQEVARQTVETEEIANRVQQAADGTTAGAGRLEAVMASATTARAASEELREASRILAELSAQFQSAIDHFDENLRAE